MKKAFVLTIGLVSLMAMSFTLPKQSKFEVVKTQNGSYITNVNLISLEDLQTLEAATIQGASETDWVHKSVKNGWINETVKSHKKPDKPEPADNLASILTKYE